MEINSNSTYELNNGIKIPIIGLGTYGIGSGTIAVKVVQQAIEVGYRHFDTAKMYNNEEYVSKGIKESKIDRKDIFITTKLWPSDSGYASSLEAYKRSYKKLDLEYIDLYLIHWPAGSKNLETWQALEKIYNEGTCRAIGVSNFSISQIQEILEKGSIKPSINQIEFNPFHYDRSLLEFCEEQNIKVVAYSPIAKGNHLNNNKLRLIASKYQKTVPQIMLRWALQKRTIVIPKTTKKSRMVENKDIFNFEIKNDDMDLIDSM